MSVLDRIRAFRYGARPPVVTLDEATLALPPVQPMTPLPDGDPIGAQGDKQSHTATLGYLAKKKRS